MMDRLTIEAAELAFRPGYPEGAEAVLLVELDGVAVQVEEDGVAVDRICRELRRLRDPNRDDRGRAVAPLEGTQGRLPRDGAHLARLLRPGRRRAADTAARGAPPDLELSQEHGLRVGNVFHAGDGNLHPLVLYDGAAPGERERAKELAEQILTACLDAGGSLTGEHGIGVDKACSMPRMFSDRDLEVFGRVRRAFDPDGLANPGKVIPTPRLCGEVPGPYRPHALELLGQGERF